MGWNGELRKNVQKKDWRGINRSFREVSFNSCVVSEGDDSGKTKNMKHDLIYIDQLERRHLRDVLFEKVTIRENLPNETVILDDVNRRVLYPLDHKNK